MCSFQKMSHFFLKSVTNTEKIPLFRKNGQKTIQIIYPLGDHIKSDFMPIQKPFPNFCKNKFFVYFV